MQDHVYAHISFGTPTFQLKALLSTGFHHHSSQAMLFGGRVAIATTTSQRLHQTVDYRWERSHSIPGQITSSLHKISECGPDHSTTLATWALLCWVLSPATVEGPQKQEIAGREHTAAFLHSLLEWEHSQDSSGKRKSILEGDRAAEGHS